MINNKKIKIFLNFKKKNKKTFLFQFYCYLCLVTTKVKQLFNSFFERTNTKILKYDNRNFKNRKAICYMWCWQYLINK